MVTNSDTRLFDWRTFLCLFESLPQDMRQRFAEDAEIATGDSPDNDVVKVAAGIVYAAFQRTELIPLAA